MLLHAAGTSPAFQTGRPLLFKHGSIAYELLTGRDSESEPLSGFEDVTNIWYLSGVVTSTEIEFIHRKNVEYYTKDKKGILFWMLMCDFVKCVLYRTLVQTRFVF